jgi:hypothetical protein
MTHHVDPDPDAGERTPDRDQRVRTLRFTHGDADQARVLWGQYTHDDDLPTPDEIKTAGANVTPEMIRRAVAIPLATETRTRR